MNTPLLLLIAFFFWLYFYIKKLKKEESYRVYGDSSNSPILNGPSVSDERRTSTSSRTRRQPTSRTRRQPTTNHPFDYQELTQELNQELTQELNVVDEKNFGAILWLAAGAAYSGGYTPAKGLLIQNWIKKQRDKLDDKKSLAFKSIAKMILTLPSQTILVSQAPAEFSGTLKSASSRIQLDAYNLIIEIIALDEELTKQELVHLKKVEKCLNLSHEKFEEVKQKYFFGLAVNSDVSDQEILTLLNVHDEWPKSRKLEYLAKEFIAWNSRSQSAPPARRKAAIQRLSMIGRARTMVERA